MSAQDLEATMEGTFEFQPLADESAESEQTPFNGILFQSPAERVRDEQAEPNFFVDLNFDQIVVAITVGKDEYNLKPFFHAPLRKVDDIQYRHEVMQDLEDVRIMAKITAFAECMRSTREHLAKAEKVYYQRQKERWFLDAVEVYCDGITHLAYDLSLAELTSRGLVSVPGISGAIRRIRAVYLSS